MVENAPAFSQALSDIVDDPRIKVTRREACTLKRETVKDVAEEILKKVLEVDICDLTQEEVTNCQRSVEIVRMRLANLKQKVKKKKTPIERPDNTFLSSSMFKELKDKIMDRMTNESDQQHLEDTEDIETEEVAKDDEFEVEDETGGFYKAFTNLKHHSDAMKVRSADILASCRQWCEKNRCELVRGLGYLLHRHYYLEDKRMASFGWDLFTKDKETVRVGEVPANTALWLMERLFLGKARHTEVRQPGVFISQDIGFSSHMLFPIFNIFNFQSCCYSRH